RNPSGTSARYAIATVTPRTATFRAETMRRSVSMPPNAGRATAGAATSPSSRAGSLLRLGRLARPGADGVDHVVRALADLQLRRVPLDLVEAQVADQAGVLDRQVA